MILERDPAGPEAPARDPDRGPYGGRVPSRDSIPERDSDSSPGRPAHFDEPPSPRRICGFWRRIAAHLVDVLILWVAGYTLGKILFWPLAALGAWCRLVGFLIAVLYFGLLNSSLMGGQTLGKGLLRIKVVDHDEAAIPPARSFLRALLLCAPFVLAGMAVWGEVTGTGRQTLLHLVVFGLGGAIGYLYLFNRVSRQSLHDLVVGSYVVRASAEEPVESAPLWRGHLLVLLAWMVAVALFTQTISPGGRVGDKPRELALVEGRLAGMEEVRAVSIRLPGTPSADLRSQVLRLRLRWERPPDFERAAAQVVETVFEEYPDAVDLDAISVTILYGYQMGIAGGRIRETYQRSPEVWREILAERSQSNQLDRRGSAP